MRLLLSISLIVPLTLSTAIHYSAQSKTIVIKTGKLLFKKKNIIISGEIKDYEDLALDFEDEKFFLGRIYIDYFTDDTLVLKLKGMAPIYLEGLNKINGEVLKISHIEFVKYSAIDTETIHTIYYYNQDSVDMGKEKIEKFYPDNSSKNIKTSISLTINKVVYRLPLITEEPYRTITWACSPGKISYRIYSVGVKKYYVLKL